MTSKTVPETGPTFELDIKTVNDDGVFSGHASIFGEVDLGRDVVQVGAFTKSLSSKPAARVKMLREHDQREPIGVWSEIIEDGKGLKVTGKLVLDTVKGRETHALMKAGAIDGLSIGYRTKSARLDKTKGVRLLDEIELHEISVVTFPMLPSATVSAVKSHNDNSFRALVEAINGARTSLKG
ncbi:HK97 family phage prohead protease [Pelagibacterium flavum]|uniref:HK97 family phage prohead protease n=1 Tax=Pelagibacterium flavum TaxID=2984530 RepID=A0ABY6IMU5_9HYPH|nr:HK97 family phage prohead protease [Pelagibacterium sp. YIM 151497]UYQ70657.1 HK97 family phage prohead protease [Pelagibacterium sp. YIM 151497]